MKWKRTGPIPDHDKWWLREVSFGEESCWMMFGRRSRRGLELVTVMLVGGTAWPIVGGRRQSMKPLRRERVTNLANQVVAYVTLMGDGVDFPPQDEI